MLWYRQYPIGVIDCMRRNVFSARSNNGIIMIRQKRVRIFLFDKIWSRNTPALVMISPRDTGTVIFDKSTSVRSGARRENFSTPRVSNIKHANGRGLRRVAVRACFVWRSSTVRRNPSTRLLFSSHPENSATEGYWKATFRPVPLTCPRHSLREIIEEAALPGA